MNLLRSFTHVARTMLGLSLFAAGSAMAQQAHTLLGVN